MQTARWRIIAIFKPLLLDPVCTPETVFIYYCPVCLCTSPFTRKHILCELEITWMPNQCIVLGSICHLTRRLPQSLRTLLLLSWDSCSYRQQLNKHIWSCKTWKEESEYEWISKRLLAWTRVEHIQTISNVHWTGEMVSQQQNRYSVIS